MRVKCLAQEHNTMSPARARTRTALSGVERTNHESTAPPTTYNNNTNIGKEISLLLDTIAELEDTIKEALQNSY